MTFKYENNMKVKKLCYYVCRKVNPPTETGFKMQGISKSPRPEYERFKLHKWSYSGLERHYFSAVDISTAIEYAKRRTKNWSNAKLYKVTYSGSWGTALWKKPED